MIRKDYILRMVEEFAKFLAAIMGLKDEGKYEEALKKIDSVYTGLLNIEPVTVKAISTDEVLDFLKTEKKFTNQYLNMVAELLYEEGMIYAEMGDPVSTRNVLEKSKVLINFLSENDQTFSYDWYEKLKNIELILEE